MPTPQWWLDDLAQRMDNRRARLGLLRCYLDGDAPLPEGAEGCREAYKQFQRKARTNLAEVITDAPGIGDSACAAKYGRTGRH
ncbi:hypothetical protein ABZ863_01710 [Saccharomonospora sp. NPDC046836]|uniref:hypothetical protein n=1 Tax=Saccharomonospora sp. NPDC046836 TaxID=3156921 RepID=UPI003410A939